MSDPRQAIDSLTVVLTTQSHVIDAIPFHSRCSCCPISNADCEQAEGVAVEAAVVGGDTWCAADPLNSRDRLAVAQQVDVLHPRHGEDMHVGWQFRTGRP